MLTKKIFYFYIFSFLNITFCADNLSIREINSAQEFQELVLKNKGLVIVDFYWTKCPPCKKLAPELEKISKEFSTYNFYKIESALTNKLNLISEYKIRGYPTVIFFIDGQKVADVVGNNPAAIKNTIINLQNKL